MPYRTHPSRRRPATSSRLPKAEAFPDSFRHACKAHEDDHHHKCIHFQQQGNLLYALMQMIIPHEITSISEMRWCYKRANEHTKNMMPGFRMLTFNVWKGRVRSKTFESLLLSLQGPILNKFESTHKFKTAQKVV